jgi:glycosyltransferase involved in cell wall biosynthesis
MSTPGVTVLVPCYQQAHFLPAALDSALAQTAGDAVEIVIVNDGSTDATHEVAARYVAARPDRVRLVEQPNRGLTLARAAGLAAARGDWLVFLDADDQLDPDMVSTCLGAAAKHPDASVVVGNALLVGADGASDPHLHVQQRVPAWPTVLEVNPFGALVGVMIRAAAVDRVGGLAVDGILGCADWELWVRLIRTGATVATIPAVLGRYRRHDTSMSRDPLLMLDSKIQMLERSARVDERLPATAGRPITRAQHARLRNGYVFHEIGSCAAGGRLTPHAPVVLDRLVAGGLDPFYCAQNFVRGWYHDRGPTGAAATRQEILSALDQCHGAIAKHGYAATAAPLGRSIERIFASRHDLRWLAGALGRRLRRVLSEAVARPRIGVAHPRHARGSAR